MDIEVWKDIVNYENIYQISNKGNVRNIKTNKALKPYMKLVKRQEQLIHQYKIV